MTSSDRGEFVSAASAVGLLVCMFAFAWYGSDGIPAVTPHGHVAWTENAWQALTVIRWAMVVTVAVALGSVVIHMSQLSHGAKTNTSPLVALLGAATAALLIYRVFVDMPAANEVVDQKLGAVLGTLCAVGIAIGGARSLGEGQARGHKRRRRRLESRRSES